ncbi:hypothetical protein [Nocardia carnea]|uniref:hypothetical protein n=1 Tax=Nocardia carnea TaxID=37328 RepID=UPI0024546E82|nr:hypothetical protein [Nocardia carnea]
MSMEPAIPEIRHAKALLGWIENCLPPIDEDRHHSWQAEPATPEALVAEIEVHVRIANGDHHTMQLTLSAPLIGSDELPAVPRPARHAAAETDTRENVTAPTEPGPTATPWADLLRNTIRRVEGIADRLRV